MTRIIELFENEIWKEVDLKDLKKNDRFRVSEYDDNGELLDKPNQNGTDMYIVVEVSSVKDNGEYTILSDWVRKIDKNIKKLYN